MAFWDAVEMFKTSIYVKTICGLFSSVDKQDFLIEDTFYVS